MRDRFKPKTLKDVSKASGVSLITVSRTLRKPSDVHESTRQKVFRAIEEIGYVPNLTARSLVSSRSNIVGVVVMSCLAPFVWTMPQSWHLFALMIAIGAFGTVGHYLLIIAHRMAPPSVLAPFMYSQLIWVIAIGYMVFDDIPSGWTLTGAAVVIASGLYLLHRERVQGKPVSSVVPPE